MKKNSWLIILSVVLAVFIGALPHQFYRWFSENLRMYPGDIWYVFDHYLQKGFPYPVEYPSLMRVFVQLVNTVTTKNYTAYLWTTIYFLLPFVISITLILKGQLEKAGTGQPLSRLYQFWILAPSFIICSTTNYDLVAVWALVAGLSLAQSGKRVAGAALLGLGTAFKVFPCFFFPLLLLLDRDKKEMAKTCGGFFGTWLAINLPYMIFDPRGIAGWFEPYAWQAAHNFGSGPDSGSIWWPLYLLLGNGSISILFIGASIIYLMNTARQDENFQENLWEWGRGIALVFLLFDRVYSPQYHLYLLPFLVLSRDRIKSRVFYLLELPNIAVLLFLFYLREHCVIYQGLMIIKYGALIMLLVHFYKKVLQKSSHGETTVSQEQ